MRIPRFFTEKSCLKLVFSTLWQASSRCQGVRMSEFELQQIALLRKELGLVTLDRTDRMAHVA